MGLSIANEVLILIFGKRKSVKELLLVGPSSRSGPILTGNSIDVTMLFLEQENPPDSNRHCLVRSHLVSELSGLDTTATMGIRKLIRQV